MKSAGENEMTGRYESGPTREKKGHTPRLVLKIQGPGIIQTAPNVSHIETNQLYQVTA